MLIGDRARFAVEFALDLNYGGVWLFGKICFWIGSQQVGNYDLGTSLRDVLFALVSVLRDAGKRQHDTFFHLPAWLCYQRLNHALYLGATAEEEERAEEEMWARFDLNLQVDVFDEWKIFLVEHETGARVLFAQEDEEPGQAYEVWLRLGEVDAILYEVYQRLDTLYEEERGKENAVLTE